MAIPWLIGAAVIGIGKAVYDSCEEDKRRDREIERAERREREANKQREEAVQKEKVREQKEQKESLEKYTRSQARNILDKYKITGITHDDLAASAILDPELALSSITSHYVRSKVHNDLVNKVELVEKAIGEVGELQKILKGL